jgi:hypothetical protein
MRNVRQARARVMAFYREGSLLFELPADTSKADLAALLDSFGRGHGEPLCVAVILPSRRHSSFAALSSD